MPTQFDELIHRAMLIGVNELAYPLDVFETARLLAEHPDVTGQFGKLLELVEDPQNHFTRWAAVRAIVILGPTAAAKARAALARQDRAESHGLARSEIQKALAMLPAKST